MRGFTMWLCFGSWGGFRWEFGGSTCFFRICLGYVAFCVSSIDVENTLARLINENAALNAKVEKFTSTNKRMPRGCAQVSNGAQALDKAGAPNRGEA